jgi:uncharacterized protein
VVVKELDDPGAFLETAEPLLIEDEARNNLILGIARTLRDYPSTYSEYRLWLVENGDRIAGAALQTPPFNLVVALPSAPAAPVLAGALHAERVELPGVTGAMPEVDTFSRAWEDRTGVRRRQRMAQRIYRLTELRHVERVPGRPRPATGLDRSLLLAWITAFGDEATAEGTPGREAERVVDQRLSGGAGGFTIWEDGAPVSVAGWGGTTPNGVRIGPVYTPPQHRRRGYGSAVTAAVSAERLASGRTFCFLYTDLANPTSNKIYTDLGYEPVCDSIDYAFDRLNA